LAANSPCPQEFAQARAAWGISEKSMTSKKALQDELEQVEYKLHWIG